MTGTNLTRSAAAVVALALAACGKKSDTGKQPPNGNSATAKTDASPSTAADAAATAPANTAGTMVFGKPVRSHPDVIDRIEAGPQGLTLTCSASAVRLWDADGMLRWGRSGEFRARACALSSDGKRVAVVERKGGTGTAFEVRISDVSGGADRWVPGAPAALALRFVGDDLLSVALDQVQLWTNGKASTVAKLPAPARTAAISADGKVVAWSDGSKVGLHTTTGEATAVPVTVEGEIKRIALSADATKVALGSDRTVTLWDVPGAKVVWASKVDLRVPHSPAVAFDAAGRVMASYVSNQVTLGDDGTWPPVTPVPRFIEWTADGAARILEGKSEFAVSVTTGERSPASPDGTPEWADNRATGIDGVTTAWTSDGCSPLRSWRKGAERSLAAPAGCDPEADGLQGWQVGATRAFAIGKTITAFDLIDGKELGRLAANGRPVEALAVSADGATALLVLGKMQAGDDPMAADEPSRHKLHLGVWSIAADSTAERSSSSWAEDVHAAAVSPDGKRVYLGLGSGHVAVLDAGGLTEVARLGPQASAVTSIEVEPKSGRIAATDLDHSTAIYPP